MTDQVDWSSVLEPGETILWQGRPNADLTLDDLSAVSVVTGLAFIGFVIFWVVTAKQESTAFSLLGLPFLIVGLATAIGSVFARSFNRRFRWYAITETRALIATRSPLKRQKIESLVISENSHLELGDGRYPSIFFARETKQADPDDYTVSIGFECLANARDVYALLRKIQSRPTEGVAAT